MKKIMLVLLLVGLSAPVAAQSVEGVFDSGKLLIFAEGKQLGAETFTIKADGASVSDSSLMVEGRTVNLKSRAEHRNLRPVSFELDQGPGMKLQVSINGAEVKMTAPNEAAAQTDADAVLLEHNTWHLYYFLVRRYDPQKGGVQPFKMFVPSVIQTVMLTLERRGTVNSPPDKPAKLEHYRAVIAGSVNIDIITDADGRLVYLKELQQKLEAVREEYVASIEQLRSGMASATKSASVDYSAPPGASFTAEEVTVKARGFTLAGTLLLPKAGPRPFPAVVTITGSGQQTRDEPLPIPGLEKYGLMRQVAETLASRGIAVLRVDDRGVGGSTGFESLATATTSGFADDVRAQVAYLRSRPEIDPRRIALVGHSEGGVIAPQVAVTDPQLAAIVLMAASGKRGDQISIDQLNEMMAGDASLTAEEKERRRAEQQKVIRAVVTGGDLSMYPAQVRLPWVKEFWTYDPLATVRKVRQPILILQGALDRQISAEQAGMLDQAAREGGNRDVAVHIFPSLNHLFLPAKTGSFNEYSTLATSTVGDDVLKTLTDWLGEKLKAQGKR